MEDPLHLCQTRIELQKVVIFLGPRCPSLSIETLNLYNIQTRDLPKGYIDTYQVKCVDEAKYRVPFQALEKIDSARLKRVQEFASEENYEFWGAQKLSCSFGSDGIAAWEMGRIVACEPRNCSTAPLLSYSRVKLEGDDIIIVMELV